MKRDMEIIRKLLFEIEENPRQLTVDGYNKEVVKYHALLLIEAGLLDCKVSDTLAIRQWYPVIFSLIV